jgi:GGDEF domain-containing protein
MTSFDGRKFSGMDAEQLSKFRDQVLIELKRAERYRNFLSLLVLNLSEFLRTAGRRKIGSHEEAQHFMKSAVRRVQGGARETDMISGLDSNHLVMLLPETDNQGAQVAAERFQRLLAEFLGELLESDYDFDIPLEIMSFPDQSGRRNFANKISRLFPGE